MPFRTIRVKVEIKMKFQTKVEENKQVNIKTKEKKECKIERKLSVAKERNTILCFYLWRGNVPVGVRATLKA